MHSIEVYDAYSEANAEKGWIMLGLHRCLICGALSRGPCVCERTAKYWVRLIDIGYGKLWSTRPEGLEVPVKALKPLSEAQS